MHSTVLSGLPSDQHTRTDLTVLGLVQTSSTRLSRLLQLHLQFLVAYGIAVHGCDGGVRTGSIVVAHETCIQKRVVVMDIVDSWDFLDTQSWTTRRERGGGVWLKLTDSHKTNSPKHLLLPVTLSMKTLAEMTEPKGANNW